MKKLFECIGLIMLVVLSFFGTEKIANVIKDNDDIMKQIKEAKTQYIIEPIDASIIDNKIIPGIAGSTINVKDSYKKMKKLNKFNSNLLVYEKVLPNNSVNRVFNKYVISGNKNKLEVGILFLIDNKDEIDDVINILGNNKATFFIDGYWFENNNNKIIELINNGHTVGNLGYNKDYSSSGVSWMNNIVTKIGSQSNTYCYNDTENEYSLNRCALNESYTIKPSLVIKYNPLITIKNNLTNGSIIALEVNQININELKLIIEYINSKGLNIVNMEKLLTE